MNFIRLLFLAYAVEAMVIGSNVASKAVKYMDNYSAETVDSAWPARTRSGGPHHLRPIPKAHVFRRADEGFTITGDTRLNTLFVSSNTSTNANTLSSTAEGSSSLGSGSGSTRSATGGDAISSSISIGSSTASASVSSSSEVSQTSDSSQPSASSSVAPSTSSPVTQTTTEANKDNGATSESTATSTTEDGQITAPPPSPTAANTDSSTPVITPESKTVTLVISGVTYLQDQYTTQKLRPTPTGGSSRSSNSKGGGLSAHDKRIVIGCVVGIGVPLLIAIVFLILYTCTRERRTDFINSEGKVITAYSSSRLSKWWNSLLGRKVIKYESDSPLGGVPLDEDGENVGPANLDNDRNASTRGYHSNQSPDLVLHEERYYDVDGNEINPKNY